MKKAKIIGGGGIRRLKDKIEGLYGTLEVKELLQELHKEFPDGFRSYDANRFLENKYGIWSMAGQLYQRLVKLGFLKKTTVAGVRGDASAIYLYRIDSHILDIISKPIESTQLDAERLAKAFITLEGIQGLEECILSNQHFIEQMQKIKERNQKIYENMGGLYLDVLIERSKK